MPRGRPRMSEQVVLKVGTNSNEPEQQSRTWGNFVRRTRMHLAVAFAIFAIGLGIGMYLYVVLGQWLGRGTSLPA